MQLILDTKNISLRVRNRSFLVSAGKDRRMISPHRISSIAVITPCTITSSAILLAVGHKIPIIFFDHEGEPEAQVWSTHFGNLAELRRAQVLFAMSEEAIHWSADLFELKTAAQLENVIILASRPELSSLSAELNKTANAIRALLKKLHLETSSSEPFVGMMGIEGAIARHYWTAFGKAAPLGFNFVKRSRRPAADPFNAALNYLYGLLYNTVEGAILGAGLDPMFGIVHADSFGAPTLVFDLIEPFRPLADRFLFDRLYEGFLDLRHFEPWNGGVGLSREGRKIMIAQFNDWLVSDCSFRGKTNTVRSHQHQYAGDLANRLKDFLKNDYSGKLRYRKRPTSLTDGE